MPNAAVSAEAGTPLSQLAAVAKSLFALVLFCQLLVTADQAGAAMAANPSVANIPWDTCRDRARRALLL
jgi:hypothetical protein